MPKMLRKCYQNEEENHKKIIKHTPKKSRRKGVGERVRRPQTPCTGYAYKLSCFLWVVRGLELHTHDRWRGKYDYDKEKCSGKIENPKLLIVNCKLPQMCRRSTRKMCDAGRITRVTNEMCCLKLPSVIRDFQHLFEVFKLINFLAKGRVRLREKDT